MARTRSLLWTAVLAVLLVLTLGGTALGSAHRENAPLTAADTATATVGTAAATPGCGKAPP
jgi:hypothetical protein